MSLDTKYKVARLGNWLRWFIFCTHATQTNIIFKPSAVGSSVGETEPCVLSLPPSLKGFALSEPRVWPPRLFFCPSFSYITSRSERAGQETEERNPLPVRSKNGRRQHTNQRARTGFCLCPSHTIATERCLQGTLFSPKSCLTPRW